MNVSVRSLINELLIREGKYLDISEWCPIDDSEGFVWVDGQWLRRCLKRIFSVIENDESASSTLSSLPLSLPTQGFCEHGKILSPSNVREGKLIKQNIYDAIEQFISTVIYKER